MDLKSKFKKLKEFWLENESKIILIFGLILVALVAFEFGLMQGQKWLGKPLIIEKTAPQEAQKGEVVNIASASQTAPQGANLASKNSLPAVRQDCALMGSKNSDKYHLPSCSSAKRIKSENVVCFKSVEDAVGKGYQPDKGCIK